MIVGQELLMPYYELIKKVVKKTFFSLLFFAFIFNVSIEAIPSEDLPQVQPMFHFQPGDSYKISLKETSDTIIYKDDKKQEFHFERFDEHMWDVIDVDDQGNAHILFTVGFFQDLDKNAHRFTNFTLQGKTQELIITPSGKISKYPGAVDSQLIDRLRNILSGIIETLPPAPASPDQEWNRKCDSMYMPQFANWSNIVSYYTYKLSSTGSIDITGYETIRSPVYLNLKVITDFSGIINGQLAYDSITGLPFFLFLTKDRTGAGNPYGADILSSERLLIEITKL